MMNAPIKRRRSAVPGAIIGISILLFLQASGLFALDIIPYISNGWELDPESWLSTQLQVVRSTNAATRALIVAQGLLALSSAIGLLCQRRTAWVLAMAVQGAQLLIALILYFTTRPWYIYPTMAFSVLAVLYLQESSVTDAFPLEPAQPRKGGTS